MLWGEDQEKWKSVGAILDAGYSRSIVKVELLVYFLGAIQVNKFQYAHKEKWLNRKLYKG